MPFNRDQRREYEAQQRAKGREVVIPPVADPARRMACLADPFKFLPTYMPDRFSGSWSPERRHIVTEILRIVRYGGDKALAAPRRTGKTSLAEGIAGVFCPLAGLLRFPLICAATGPDATRILSNIKSMFDDPADAFLADFPEVVTPIVELEGAPQRCSGQTVGGERTRSHWSSDHVQFPRVRLNWCPACLYPESLERKGYRECPKCGEKFQPWLSVASGRKIGTRGLDAAIRGVRVGKDRPDFALIDDPETRESARSAHQCEVRELIIDNDIGGAGGGSRRIPRLVLTTLMSSTCLSAKLTDRDLKSAFDGERIGLVSRWPDAKGLWDQYIDMRREDQQGGDQYGRRAHAFYVANREAMDAGGVVTNDGRFDATLLPDGTQNELSTLQFIHNVAADAGWPTVFCEYQNDPPSEAADAETRLTPFKVRGSHKQYAGRVSGVSRRVIPESFKCLTAFIDVQKRTLWYEVVAWCDGRRAHVIDYGNFGDATLADVVGQSQAARMNLRDLMTEWDAKPYHLPNGDARSFNLVLVDSSYETEAVRETVIGRGSTTWRVSRGDPSYSHPSPGSAGKRPSRSGDRYYEKSDGRVMVVHFDPSWWKHRCHDSFTVPPAEQPENCVLLFGDNPKDHAEFGEQICAEEWREERVHGRPVKADWFRIRDDNHLLDCHVGNMVAASLCGISVVPRSQRPRITLSQLAAQNRGRR